MALNFSDRDGKIYELVDGILTVSKRNGKLICQDDLSNYILLFYTEKNFAGMCLLVFTNDKMSAPVICNGYHKKDTAKQIEQLYLEMKQHSIVNIQDNYMKSGMYNANSQANEEFKKRRTAEDVRSSDSLFISQLKGLPGAEIAMTTKEIKHLRTTLLEDEEVRAIASGFMNYNTWLIACTNYRIVFIDRGMIYGTKQHEVPLERINAIRYISKLLLADVIIRDGAGEMIIKNIDKKSVKPFVDSVNKGIIESRNRPIRVVSDDKPQISIADELSKLSDLMSRGILTPKEFEEQKEKLLK